MSEQELVDVLSVHADSLKDGVDLTDELLAAKTQAEGEVLESLLRLARQVKAALAPVAPRADFVARLQLDLRREARQAAEARQQTESGERRRWIGIAAGLGALVYFAGLTWVSVKWSLAVFGFFAGLLGLKTVRSAGTASGTRSIS
jgi:Flp pilus assembly protein TadB